MNFDQLHLFYVVSLIGQFSSGQSSTIIDGSLSLDEEVEMLVIERVHFLPLSSIAQSSQ